MRSYRVTVTDTPTVLATARSALGSGVEIGGASAEIRTGGSAVTWATGRSLAAGQTRSAYLEGGEVYYGIVDTGGSVEVQVEVSGVGA